MLLIVGTKLEVAITRMCLESSSEGSVVPGTLCVRPNDSYFWFGQPRFILQIVHFILFQNAFQVAYFIWAWCKFGFPSCFHRETEDITLSIGIGGLVQILCAYVTLPLHVLVTRVGSSKTEIIFTEDIIRGLRNWRRAARKNLATMSRADSGSRHTVVSPEPVKPSPGLAADHPSPRHLLVDEPVEAEKPCDLSPPTCRLPVQEIEETRESIYTPGGETVVSAGEEVGAGEETAPSPDDGKGTSYDGEVSFGIWQLQLQQEDCEISEHSATETVRGP
ncbi:hypothetical protein Taro_056173 [Colocasia esculenta]|uniref:Uncharacterized protein n=1 Tax=Colocasia esculenta TaxID=4460 RepID=A0A843XVT5_COLES|nr:hypothetical protein [Colocasia esculenta]